VAKRTFVLFFCLVQFLAVSLLSTQSEAFYGFNVPISSDVNNVVTHQDPITCEQVCEENIPIIQADQNDLEWKESLSDLLRHRSSHYRFVTFDTVASVYFHFATDNRFFQIIEQSNYLFRAEATRPDYYSFLHRLYPF
jgi:hypothetical protein